MAKRRVSMPEQPGLLLNREKYCQGCLGLLVGWRAARRRAHGRFKIMSGVSVVSRSGHSGVSRGVVGTKLR